VNLRDKQMPKSLSQHELPEEIAKLRLQYVESLVTKMSYIQILWNDIVVTDWNESKLDRLGFEFHSLTNARQSFDFKEIIQYAKSAQGKIRDLVKNKAKSPFLVEKLDQIITRLNKIISDRNLDSTQSSLYAPLAHKPIYILRQDEQKSAILEKELVAQNYRVINCSHRSQLGSSVKEFGPGLIILDLIYGNVIADEKNILSKIRKKQSTYSPAVFISDENTIEARLTAVKLGGDAFFTNDFNIRDMLDKVDHMTARYNSDPYRILLVDDDKALIQVYEKYLLKAGLTVDSINNPLEILSKLVDFRPDIILLDNEMPHCTGLELAKLLKQHEAHYKLPIVFLTADKNLKTAFKARQYGADDFLTKPIKEEHLITTVVNHAQKARMFTQEISLDSMTGLLSHEMFETELKRQIKQLARSQEPLCFCMLDLDNFKLVNDNFGHLMGDTVLKNFSNLLKDKFRATDFIGRYGGEEFAIIFPNTQLFEATKLLEGLRIEYQELKNFSGSQVSINTVSIGLTETSGARSYIELIDAADRALYRAKSSGRNRLEIDSNKT
jgi:diguanylate cyclase (GGDEF)-like protein